MNPLDVCMDATGVQTMWVAVYCRVSTDEQAEGTSLDDQEFGGRGWVAAQGDAFRLRDVYRDDYTGTTDDRPQWQRLLADVRAGLVHVIVVSKWDRWARDAFIAEKMRRDIAPYGVRVVCLTLDVDASTPEGGLMVHQMDGYSEYEKKIIVRRCALGRHGMAVRGFWPGTVPRYGYRREGSKRAWTLAPDFTEDKTGEGDVLRRAWAMIVREGATYRHAAVSLNAAGLTRRGGKPWDEHALRDLLVNPNVTGVFTWADGKRATGKWGPPQTLTFPGVLTADEHRALLAATNPGQRKTPERRAYLLSGRMTAPCGRGHGGYYRNDRDTRAYRCDGKRWRPDVPRCACIRLDADTVEARVWQAVADFLSDGERMNRIAADYLGLRDVQVSVERDELAEVRRHLATLERAITSAYTDGLRAGLDPGALKAATAAIQTDLDAAREREAAILAWQADSAAEAARVRTIAEIAACARERLATMPDHERAEVLRLLDVRVTVQDNSKTPALAVEGRLAWLDLRTALAPEPGNHTEDHL